MGTALCSKGISSDRASVICRYVVELILRKVNLVSPRYLMLLDLRICKLGQGRYVCARVQPRRGRDDRMSERTSLCGYTLVWERPGRFAALRADWVSRRWWSRLQAKGKGWSHGGVEIFFSK